MTTVIGPARPHRTSLIILGALALAVAVYHMATAAFSSYGYFIDELYYLSCARHLALGYVDHPPLSILLLWLSGVLFGDSVAAIRVLPALASGGIVFLTGTLARRMGGNTGAMILAGLASAFMPVYLLMGSFYSMNVFEPLVWTAIIHLVIRVVDEDNPRLLLWVGLLLGIGLELKHTMIVYAAALVVGVLSTGARRHLFTRWFAGAVLVSFLLIIPNLVWQIRHDFISLEFYRNAMVNKNIPRGPVVIILDQILLAGPLSLVLWLPGLAWLLFSRSARNNRFLAVTALVLFVLMILSRSSRPDRIGALYTSLFAAGGVSIGQIGPSWLRRGLTMAAACLVLAGGLVILPAMTPLLPPPVLARYLVAIGFSVNIEAGKQNEALPQWLGDRLGWRNIAEKTAAVYQSLSPEEKRSAVIVANNYGLAGVVDLYGPALGLPQSYSTHNSYHLWGAPPDSATTYLCVAVPLGDLEGKFDSVIEAGAAECDYCSGPQRRVPIYIARGPKFTMSEAWPTFRNYN